MNQVQYSAPQRPIGVLLHQYENARSLVLSGDTFRILMIVAELIELYFDHYGVRVIDLRTSGPLHSAGILPVESAVRLLSEFERSEFVGEIAADDPELPECALPVVEDFARWLWSRRIQRTSMQPSLRLQRTWSSTG